MSTRSGKRIHATIDSPGVDTDVILQSERKTRSKKHKENIDNSKKKRLNYVTYPIDEDPASMSSNATDTQQITKKNRKSQRNTLKQQNDWEITNDNKSVRKTRRGQKLIKESENTSNIVNIQNNDKPESTSHTKRYKNKKLKNYIVHSVDKKAIENLEKKKGNKRNKRLNSVVVNDLGQEHINIITDDRSIDSYYSAAGSPDDLKRKVNQTEEEINFDEQETEINTLPSLIRQTASNTLKLTGDGFINKRKKSSFGNPISNKLEKKDFNKQNFNSTIVKSLAVITTFNNTTEEVITKKQRKASIKNSTFDKTEDLPIDLDTTMNISLRKRKRSSINASNVDCVELNNIVERNLNTTFEKTANISTTFNTSLEVPTKKSKKSSINNLSSDKIGSIPIISQCKAPDGDNFHLTFNHTGTAGGLINGSLTDNDKYIDNKNVLNSKMYQTSNNSRKCSVKNSTFDKDENILDNDTIEFESFQTDKSAQKTEMPNDLEQVLTSTGISKEKHINLTINNRNRIELNVTFDSEKLLEKPVDSNNSSLISSDGTINLTFDKSGDNSQVSISSDESKTENLLNHTPLWVESSIDESLMLKNNSPKKSEVHETPLKREGTFTKEVPDFMNPLIHKNSSEKTPVKRKSSPGCTPFPYSKSTQKENFKLNVTRSIEKRTSLVETGSRQTRVMFCSPRNNPATVSQMKGRVIKSSLKGSNKSFVFDESVSSEASRGRRKRSLTVSTVGHAGGTQQHSITRLSRPRTLSAAAKLHESGTSPKKFGTPSERKPGGKVSRTKLPNFAALHRKQFARMESLDECQERKAKRARQLLTPTGSVGLLERISPKDTPPRPAPPTREPLTEHQTPSKAKLPTLEALNPGYTRFGFKLNGNVNPFSVARKTEARKDTRPGGPSRQTSCLVPPSLAGAAAGAGRRDAAKQAVMREKSFSEKRDANRKETRTVIKGVRTNRRFELQMQLRNINV